MKTTSRCQITLPLRLRMEAGIKPNEEVETFIIEHGGRSVIAVAPASNTSKGEALAARWVGTLGQGEGFTHFTTLKIPLTFSNNLWPTKRSFKLSVASYKHMQQGNASGTPLANFLNPPSPPFQ